MAIMKWPQVCIDSYIWHNIFILNTKDSKGLLGKRVEGMKLMLMSGIQTFKIGNNYSSR